MERVNEVAALEALVRPLGAFEREEKKEEDMADVEMVSAFEQPSGRRGDAESRPGDDGEEDADDEEEEEEEVLVVLELCDFKNHPVFDDYASLTLEGLDSAAPTLKIGEFTLHGQLEETVGTSFFYDTTERAPDNAYRFAGQTVRKIKFTIEPPEQPPTQLA